MLVESMNEVEITNEVLKDFSKLRETTSDRLANEYDKERRKFKIDNKKIYPIVYPVKTAAKNTWLLFLSKAPAHERYKGIESINVSYLVYYYNSKGLRVFNCSSGGFIEVYNGHFFKRYNERLNLNLNRPLDIVKSYFMHGCHAVYSVINKNDKKYTIGVSVEGILLGELRYNGQWLINKTFISRDISRPDQDEVEHELINSLKKDIEKALIFNNVSAGDLKIYTNVMNALTIQNEG
jgi:hypothetical protein